MEFEIRQMTGKELEEGFALAREVFSEAVAPGCTPEAAQSCIAARIDGEAARRDFSEGIQEMFGAYDDGKLTGMVAISERDELSLLFVAPGCRGSGIGSELVHCAYYQSMMRRAPKITVDAFGDSEGFFASLGFVRQSDPYDRDGISCVPMAFDLSLESPWQPWEEESAK